MTVGVRLFVALSLVALASAAAVLLVPDLPGVGPVPNSDEALAWLSDAVRQPQFLAPFGLALALFAWARTQPPTFARAGGPASLGPVASGLSKTQLLEATRAAFAARAPAADGLVLAELLVHAGVRVGASDIHLQPVADGATVSVRVDGSLEPLGTVPFELCGQLTNRLKVLARLTHHVTDKPQDGQFTMQTPDGTAEVRLSLLPTQHGEKAVMRLAGLGNQGPRFDSLNLPDSVRAQLTRVLEKPQGLLFFTGPTGSGKTTSIYAAVAHLQETRGALVQIATIEDPIEFSLPGIAQTQVNRAAGLDFATGLRALLRQDPNVLVVGEIRDTETARIATQAALTGHLILTTVHADSAVGVFNRLLEMGVESSVLASVSLAVFSQRLLRRLCPHCRRSEPPTDEQRQRLLALGEQPDGYWSAPGCEECGGTGIAGRAAVFEVLLVSDAVREELRNAPSTQRLMTMATNEGLVPLRVAALKRARAGEVSLAEALRVTD